MAAIIAREALPHSATAHRFEGEQYGDVGVSFFLVDAPPGGGPGLHTHPYAEVFVMHEGEVTFTVGAETIEATAGQILIVPPGVPHKYVNNSTRRAPHRHPHQRAHGDRVAGRVRRHHAPANDGARRASRTGGRPDVNHRRNRTP